MNAHIITIGDEILIGQTLNTNAAHIGKLLVENQINVIKTSVVGDDEEQILKEFDDCLKANDVVIVTGGLGPTHDDVTRQCVVKFFKTELAKSNEVLEDIKTLFSKRGRELTKVNEDQALIPKIAVPIRNTRGTAPGFWIEEKKKIFVVMPGVPYEMSAMMDSFVMPMLLKKMPAPEKFQMRKIREENNLKLSLFFQCS